VNASTELRAAADHIDELGAKASTNICPEWTYSAVRHIARNCDIECSHGGEPDDGLDHRGWDRCDDSPWITLMGSQMAPHLADWLRSEARLVDVQRADFVDPDERSAIAQVEGLHRYSLALVRALTAGAQ